MSQAWASVAGPVGEILPTDPGRIAFISLILGHCFHLSIRDVEIDFRIWSLLGLYVTLWIVLTGLYVNVCDLRLLQAIGNASLCGLFFNIGLTVSIAIYRLFFHRTRHFPGPFGSKLSRFYAIWLSSKSIQYHFELQKLHEKYGDFVRTGTREISIIRPAAVYAIYGPQSECRKATWYSQVSDDPNKSSVHLFRDPEQHRRRRRAWDRGFGMKALKTYEPRIQSKIDVLIKQLKSQQNSPVNVTAWSMYLAFDIMGTIGFSKDLRQLEDASETRRSKISTVKWQFLVF
ncbi:hypothetical protein VTN77DRAFT_1749 [Rasamsonia byssochlamydoides]|uniref:uncharacterized protein n=1 Tax=Rasamsonia byssochlamydoides TaxID=89139 RepID=UPI003744A294